ncbi:M23 family metallopeptidase [Nocardioides sp. R-C-SC26]|uniref:M23 family metallopeptidase n=1 Tax=Nocardioides sp. R-C-SC26 TaxID=2870414 RepID=UPI001E5991AD|nr:M23 family metallopeptidase [Nocardioides sp. R-C-SC26]
MRTILVALILTLLAASDAAADPPGSPRPTPTPVGVWPLEPEPRVVEHFDPPSDPYASGHRGVDLLATPGASVRAAMAGTVTFAAQLAGRGVVVVDHGDTRTTYEPVSASVSRGDVVAAGDRIGALALPGSHCFPRACLHWGWRAGELYLDPLELVGAGPIRLLPLWRDLPAASTAPAVAAARAAPRAGLSHPYAVLELW